MVAGGTEAAIGEVKKEESGKKGKKGKKGQRLGSFSSDSDGD